MSLEEILTAIEKPLSFAAKNSFANLPHIKNLNEVIPALADKALSYANSPNHKDLLLYLKKIYSSYDALDETRKRTVIQQSLSILKELRAPSPVPRAEELRTVSWHEAQKMLGSSIQYVKGVGPKLFALLAKKNISTIEDALYFLPRTYLDRRNFQKIAALRAGEDATIMGVIISTGKKSNFKRRTIFEIAVDDGTQILIAKWFNYSPQYQGALKNKFKNGQKVILSGRVADFRFQKEIHHPDIELIDEEDEISPDFRAIIPVYPLSEGLHQKTLRKIMRTVVDTAFPYIAETLPVGMVTEYSLVSPANALARVHFPDNRDNFHALVNFQSAYHRRLVFEELFYLELGLAMKKKGLARQPGIAMNITSEDMAKFIASLPFSLTAAQQRSLSEILADMNKPFPMNRLIQGDVGSGKTVVALLASLAAIVNGYQAVFMTPTEILAEQHYKTISTLTRSMNIRVVLLTGSQNKVERTEILQSIQSGSAHLVIGTHTLIQDAVEFHRLGLVVIDEQHKFGVMQRAQLKKKGENPDVLVMTATPIPRTLGLTVYGDLDLSLIDELPQGRTPVATKVFHEKNREEVYDIVRTELSRGSQTFIVYPLVEESEKMDLKDATNMARHLQQDIFPAYRVGLIHGKMAAAEKDAIMAEFQKGHIHILVATTVIEVGIDIPNASLMIIEHAERFGLSQLHQLRGRVGRGTARSTCILLAQYRKSDDARRRLAIMEQTNDGFKIAEEDFNIRGPGEFLGTRQSGLPDFRVANILRDVKVLHEARRAAFELAARDPDLAAEEHQLTRKALAKLWKGRLELAGIG
jgi:ATP-dependent DNA helicase RecG